MTAPAVVGTAAPGTVEGYDPFSFEVQHNPYPTYRWLRDEAPVYRSETHGFYALSRYEDVMAAHLQPRSFVSSHGVTLEGHELGGDFLILKDPPEHDWHRRVVSRVFTPRAVAALEPFVRQVAGDLLDPLVAGGRFDVVEDFSIQLPLRVACELFQIPAGHRQQIHVLSDRLVARDDAGSITADAATAAVELAEVMADLVRQRRARPGDDVFSTLVTTPVVDDEGTEHHLSDAALTARFLELAFAGHETVARLVPNGVVALSWFPDERRKLVDDPGRVRDAVEEMLRWDTPSHYQGRWSTEPTQWHGRQIPAGSRVLLVTAAANHDPRRFEHPALFSVDRRPDRILSFGWGVHLCLGANLARMEATVAFQELLRRCPRWDLDESGVVRLRSGNVRGLAHLPVAVAA